MRATAALSLLLLALVACGGSSSSGKGGNTTPESGEGSGEVTGTIGDEEEGGPESTEPDYESIKMESSDNIIPAIKIGVEQTGCTLVAAEGQDLTATCEEDTIFLRQRGPELQWACQSLEPDPCRQLLMKIINAAVGG